MTQRFHIGLLWGPGEVCVPTEDAADKTEAAADPTSMVLPVDSNGIEMFHLPGILHAPQASTVSQFFGGNICECS